MRKSNRLLSILLSVLMLVSMIPQASFADEGNVARIGDTEYATLEDAFDYSDEGDVIELLANAEIKDCGPYFPCTVSMNGFSITGTGDKGLCVNASEGEVAFNGGTINGKLLLDCTDGSVVIDAPAGAEYAVNGDVDITSGSLTVKGNARVGIKGTLKTSYENIDISGTEKAVELTEAIDLRGISDTYKIVGSDDYEGTMLDASFESDTGTYMAGSSAAKRIKAALKDTGPAKPVPSVSPENATIYTGQIGTFNITFDGDEDLTAYVQQNAQDNISATLSEDQRTVTVSVPKDAKPGKYILYVRVTGDAFRQAKTEFTVAVCNHENIDDDEDDRSCKCKTCGRQMVRLSESDKAGEYGWINTAKYFETIDEAIAAIPDYDDIEHMDGTYDQLRYQYEVRYYEDITLDHDLIVKDKPFNIAANYPKYDAKLSFTDGHSMVISRDTVSKLNSVDLYQIKDIGSITLGKNAYLTAFNQTVDNLILADTTADLGSLVSEDASATDEFVSLKIKHLEAAAPGCTIGDFLQSGDRTLAYRYCDTDRQYGNLRDYVNETYLTEVSNVAVVNAPIRNFNPELDEASKNAVYPSEITINLNATVDSDATARYKVVKPDDLLQNCIWGTNSENNKIVFSEFPAGTYNVGIEATATVYSYEYVITKYLPVTVEKKSIDSSDIKIKINGKDTPCEFPYARGRKSVAVQVYDNDKDVTEEFNISGDLRAFNVFDNYEVLVKAKEDGGYTGSKTVNYSVTQIDPEENTDYKVDMPASLVYDGTPKSVTVTELNDSQVVASEITYAKATDDGYSEPVSEAPTQPGTYKVYVTLPETHNYNYKQFTTDFTIEKADVKFEYTKLLKDVYNYEDDKRIAGKILKSDSAAENIDAPTGTVQITGIKTFGSDLKFFVNIPIKDDGSFEFELPPLSAAGMSYKIIVQYLGDDYYKECFDPNGDYIIAVGRRQLNNFSVSNNEHRYAPGVERKVTVSAPESRWLTNDDFVVKYYLVDENSGKLASTEPVEHTISAGRYLYVISLKDEHKDNYGITFEYKVDGKADIPDTSFYKNTGFMDIKASSDFSQKPISFEKGIVNIKSGEKFTNTLKNENASTVTYESSDTDVVYVDRNGEITAKKSGTATITATSTMEGATPVYASYTVNVKKELTKDCFEISATEKSYDGSKSAVVTATLKDEYKADQNDVVKAEITAEFDKSDAGSRTVIYEITGISGKNADKYVLSETAENLKGEVNGTIRKAVVTVICARVTTRTFDGTAQTADVSAMANGRIFDISNYTVKYAGETEAVKVGEYSISIELSDTASANYEVEPFNAVLKIVNAAQDIFAVENVPENVYYGDTFAVSATGADGDVTYEITDGGDIAEISANGEVKVKDVGRVTIKATSKKDGYTDRTAVKTFEAKKRILTPSATAVNREYNGENGVSVDIALSGGIVTGDTLTASASGSMINSDAGSGKIVYVSAIALSDNEKYTLSTNSLQTTVDITPIEIKDFAVSAMSKKYDGTANAQASVGEISDVIEGDKGFVSIAGTAEFDTADSGTDKTVTFTASGLSGAKAHNYTLGKLSAAATADIEPLKVNFTVGQTSFVYDGKDKEINISATDENGRIFDGFTVNYDKTPNAAGTYTAKVSLNDAKNYVTTQGDIAVTVEAATQNQLVIAGLPGTVEYLDEFKLEAFGGAEGGTVSWKVTEGKASISEDGTVTVDGIGKIEITAVKSSANYADISSKVIFTAMPKNITFELDKLEQIYGSTMEVSVNPSDSRITAGDFEVKYNGSEDVPKNAGKYRVEVTATNPNYKGSAHDTLVIAKAKPSGSIQISSEFTYGDTVSAAVNNISEGTSAKITYAGTGIYIPQEEAPKNAGNYTAIAEITGENYETLTVTKNFTIKKATLTVKAENASRAYGDANPIFKLKYEGFVSGDNESVLLYEPSATVNANASSAVGKYNITVSGGYAENYQFAYDNTGELEITGASGAALYITGSSTAYVNDKFALAAFYGNTKINAAWKSSDPAVAEVDENGTVTAKSAGTVTITATADGNYGNAEATFDITVKQSDITLVPTDLVKTYNGERQEISFEPVSDFTPVIGQNITVKYALITDPAVTEPIKAGTYSVTYTISDGSFVGGGTTTMYINKAKINVIPDNATKVYGDKPEFSLLTEVQTSLVSSDELKKLAENTEFTSDGAAETAPVGEYDITAVLGTYENENISFTANGKGKLTVTKAPLTVKLKDAVREYGAENPALEVEYEGFKNGETEDVLGGTLSFSYNGITKETEIGTYTDKTCASGLTSGNYEISYKNGNITVTPISVTAKAGEAKRTYLTVVFDRALKGITKDNFTVKAGGNAVGFTDIAGSDDGKTYTLNGSFTAGTAYTVEISYADSHYSITGSPLRITPKSSYSGGGGSFGGGGGSSSTYYTVSFDANGGGEIASQTVKKNETAAVTTAPTKEGYDFAGWYTDKELKTKYDFSEKVTADITLYAAWTEKDNKADSEDDNSKNQIILTIGKKEATVFGTVKSNDVAPIIANDRTMLPARFVAENLGASVDWDDEKKLVTIVGKNLKTGKDTTLLIYIGSDIAYVNGREIKLDSPAFIENDRTYMPIRFISEELGADVEWLESDKKVVITK